MQTKLRTEKCTLDLGEFCELGKQEPFPRGSETIFREEKETQQTKKKEGGQGGGREEGMKELKEVARPEEGMVEVMLAMHSSDD